MLALVRIVLFLTSRTAMRRACGRIITVMTTTDLPLPPNCQFVGSSPVRLRWSWFPPFRSGFVLRSAAPVLVAPVQPAPVCGSGSARPVRGLAPVYVSSNVYSKATGLRSAAVVYVAPRSMLLRVRFIARRVGSKFRRVRLLSAASATIRPPDALRSGRGSARGRY